MPIPPSSLSRVCRSVADFLSAQVEANLHSVRVLIGGPAEAAKEAETEHRLNLFFYLIEPFGFGPDPAAGESWLVRLHCLITPFSVAESPVSAGENDLRLLGEVLRAFHESPVLPLLDVDGRKVRLQAVLNPLTLDQINHLWATQGDVGYRLSLAYELTLVPILPRTPAVEGPLVSGVSLEVRGELDHGSQADWAPRICLVVDGTCQESLRLAVGSPELAAFEPRVWIAGEPGSPVILRWEAWEREDGWRAFPETVPAQATSTRIDPEAATTAATTSAPLPWKDRPGQLMLYAVRSATRPSDGLAMEVRSNPVLLSLFEEGS